MESNKKKSYKESLDLEARQSEFNQIKKNHPDKITIIIEKHSKSKLPNIDRSKYNKNMN